IGAGPSALATAETVTRAGGEPFLVSPHPPQNSSPYPFLAGRLVDLAGWPGGFRAIIEGPQGTCTHPAAGLVLALEMDEADQTESLEQERDGGRVALLAGFWSQPPATAFGRVLTASLDLARRGGRVLVFTPHLKVAAPGLEKLYTQARRAGVLFFRLDDPPAMEESPQGLRLAFIDPVLAAPASVEVDRAVSYPPARPSAQMEELSQALNLITDPGGWPALENLLFPAPLTSRAGVWAVGGCGGGEPELLADDLRLLAADLDDLFHPPGQGLRAVRVASQRRECALCLTCLRVCPVGAIGWDDGPVVMESFCLACGQCVGACPATIIQPFWPEEEALARVVHEPGKGRLVLACQRSIEAELPDLPPETKMVRLGCAGRVSEELVWRLLAQGYSQVVVAACHEGNCRSLTGSARARRVVDQVRLNLAHLGMEPEQIIFTTLAPNQTRRLEDILRR
ncbi:MAG: hydrogenase iron-sulfur subunit, partial [Deltaproteobacteria bacterium]|nr:hydrogenase iron-sulfur subunit [Deltaproteobacteria bacterium]